MSIIDQRKRLALIRRDLVLAEQDRAWSHAHVLSEDYFQQIRLVHALTTASSMTAWADRKNFPFYWIPPLVAKYPCRPCVRGKL